MEKIFASAKDLKRGKYMIIDDIPCRVVEIEVSKSGKHGSGKMRVTAIGVFENQKKTWLGPSDSDIEVPIIERKNAQVVTVSGNSAQVMDTKTYEVYDITVPEDLVGQVNAGEEVEILEALGKRSMQRVK